MRVSSRTALLYQRSLLRHREWKTQLHNARESRGGYVEQLVSERILCAPVRCRVAVFAEYVERREHEDPHADRYADQHAEECWNLRFDRCDV